MKLPTDGYAIGSTGVPEKLRKTLQLNKNPENESVYLT
jgi:hypothetical protein